MTAKSGNPGVGAGVGNGDGRAMIGQYAITASRALWMLGGILILAANPAAVVAKTAPRHSALHAAADPATGADVVIGDARLHGRVLPGGVAAFLGVPYASPPVGEHRWHVSTEAVVHGPIDASQFGPACPQTDATAKWYRDLAAAMGSDPDAAATSPKTAEDCLFLNVWTPKPHKLPAGTALAVMVWIHGGSNVTGYSQEADYDGARLAGKGVVVVSINYRLGQLGFFAHPAIPDVSAGRQGISDQITGLRWVRDHIGAFGGDPARVTVFGESAGGTDIAALMHMPVAKGLFARAIIESGFLGPRALATPAVAAAVTTDLFARDLTAAALMQRSAADIVRTAATGPKRGFLAPLVPAAVAFMVPVLIGTNNDEYRLYLPKDPVTRSTDEAAILAKLPRGDDVARILQHVSDDPARRADLLGSAPAFHCPATRLAAMATRAGHPAFVYRFDRVRPGRHGLGAYHGAEIPYVFGTTPAWLPSDPADTALGETVMRYWINFARTGNPNGPGLPQWPRWPAASGDGAGYAGADADKAMTVPIMHLGTTVHAAPTPDLALCPLLDQPAAAAPAAIPALPKQ